MHVLKLILRTTKSDRREIAKRFALITRMHNILVSYAKKLLRELNRNRKYKGKLREYNSLKKAAEDGDKEAEARRKVLSTEMNEIRERIGLTKSKFEQYMKLQQHMHKKDISSQQAQVEADRVWNGVEKVLFEGAKDIHYKKSSTQHSIGGKSNGNGAKFTMIPVGKNELPKCYVEWCGLTIPVKLEEDGKILPSGMTYLQEALSHTVKYCTIIREEFMSGYRYYVQLTLDGEAPKRFVMGKDKMGLDEGPSTIAGTSESLLILEELAPHAYDYEKEIGRQQQRIDVSTRLSNPENYNDNGTCKKGKHKWTFSKTCMRRKRKVRVLYRKCSARTKHGHNAIANKIIQNASIVYNEPMDFKALMKRSKKKTERTDKVIKIKNSKGEVREVHKCKKKKRFGHSITSRSPSYLTKRIEMKMAQYEGSFFETDKWTFRASQYDHVKDEYRKAPLSERMKEIGGKIVQRDLYSGFLQSCSDITLTKPDRKEAIRKFDNFVKLQDELIKQMKKAEISRPCCFGF